jgi:hypothetical protein
MANKEGTQPNPSSWSGAAVNPVNPTNAPSQGSAEPGAVIKATDYRPMVRDQPNPAPIVGDAFNPNAPAGLTSVRKYKILRGNYSRREFRDSSDKKGQFVNYRAGSERDELLMTDAEADKFGRRFLAEFSEGGIFKPTKEQVQYTEDMRKAQEKTKGSKA